MTNIDPNRQKLIDLRKLLIEHFDLEELRLLCFDLGLDYEVLAGRTKSTKMQELITYLHRRGELQRLVDEASGQRPHAAWPDLSPTTEETDVATDTGADIYTDAKSGPEMIRIPAGEFIYGEDSRLDYLPEFWISKTPVTNAQYFRFVRVTGHGSPQHWKGKSPKAELANHPVRFVSWHDAKAYTGWAGMNLPTEDEWEKAARGTEGRIFPWGNEWRDGYCNTIEAGIGSTTSVSQYSPQGDSPYGCVDMAGNVWEWTESWYDEKEKQRVVRGGAWLDGQDLARADVRAHGHPTAREEYLGFRVVARRPPTR
jgi:formylglycine-generating enzyme required for sulfatase activity